MNCSVELLGSEGKSKIYLRFTNRLFVFCSKQSSYFYKKKKKVLNNFDQIQQKLHHFIKKYYTNEMIKGSILFLSFGLLYLIFTLLLEYFLWLKPFARTILFWVFIAVEIALLIKFIFIPLFKLFGLQKGISLTDASNIIGTYFKEVDDKLLNVLQLHEKDDQSELLLASIEQKSKDIQPVPFKNAIHFSANKKYLKYLSIPLIIFLFSVLTGNDQVFTNSLDRVVHHKIAYSPPAPFHFKVTNKDLQTIESKSFELFISTIGDIKPEKIKIVFNKESYFLNKLDNGDFIYRFDTPVEDIDFYLEANKVVSQDYTLMVIPTPRITDFEMQLNYPKYIKRKNEVIQNTGNATIPQGTKITWSISTKNTKLLRFDILNQLKLPANDNKFSTNEEGKFELSKSINQNIDYQINTSNSNLKKFEKLNYSIRIIKDQYPNIKVRSDIDSVSRGPVQFIGQLSDDYGLSKLQITARNIENNKLSVANIDILKKDFEEFFYVFPNGLILDENASYEIFFDVFDNDAIQGRKKTRSQLFYYRNKSQQQIKDEILKEQKQNIEDLENSTKSSEDLQKAMDEFSKKLKTKNKSDWNDKKQLEDFIQRQEKYQKMMQKNKDNLFKNLEDMEEEENNLDDKKEELKKRLEESKELQKKEDLLKELKELADKLKKEDLIEKIDKLNAQTKQETRSLERILELTKRYYVEKKTNQIIEKLQELSKEQEDLSNMKENNSKDQKELNNKFDSIQKDFKDLEEQNNNLKEKMPLPDTKDDEKLIEMDMQMAMENLENGEENSGNKEKKNAGKNQRLASKRMKELSKKLEAQMMQIEEESSEENIKDLQQILENLVIFSFDQEALMLGFKEIDSKNASYPDKLKKQVQLKEYFEHIDDSLYTLSLRLVKISSKIQKDLADAHYNLDKSLENMTDNKINNGIKNQQYTMTAANNLADLLSDILQNLQNKKPRNGKGKGKKGEDVSLPDIIKKQGKMIEKMKDGMMPKNGKQGKSKEQMTSEQYEIYKEQSILKKQLEDLLRNDPNAKGTSKSLLKKMDDLEKLLLEKGITKESLELMQKLEYELLKLEKATFDQNKDSKRKSEFSRNNFNKKRIKSIQFEKIFLNKDEILIRRNFDFQPLYKIKTKEYFINQ